jgi:predicted DNA-binding antitoxin AbrB/MazE fold protein
MRPVKARYEDGFLRPVKALPLRPGEQVGVIVIRQSDATRWDLSRVGAAEDEALATAGLAEWADALDHQDKA